VLVACLAVRAARAGVVINELHYHPVDDPDGALEFIEIHNAGDVEVDLHGWELRGGVRFRFDRESGPVRIAPRGFLVVAPDPQALRALHDLEAEAVTGPYAGRLANRGDRVELADGAGAIADRVAYEDDGLWPAAADGLGPSLQRVTAGAPGHLPRNWAVHVEEPACGGDVRLLGLESPMRWREDRDGRGAGGPPAAGALPWHHPDFADGGEPWRDGALAIGYQAEGAAAPWVRTESSRVPGLHSLLVRIPFTAGEELLDGRLRLDMDWDDGFIAWLNGIEIAREGMRARPGTEPVADGRYLTEKMEPGGEGRPAPRYAKVYRGPAAVLRPGRNVLAIGNYNSGSASSDLLLAPRLVWSPGPGPEAATPGEPNSVAAGSLPPLVVRLDREPEEPTSRDAVTVRAAVEGDGGETVTLYYRIGKGKEEAVAMRPEPTSSPGPPSTRVYAATLLPGRAGSVVRLRVVARGVGGGATSFPREGNPSLYAGYHVGDRRLEENTDLAAYHLLWEGDLSCSRGRWTEGAVFVHRGTAYLDVKVKHRGETSCWQPKRGLRVAFPKGERFRGQSRLNFLAGFEDRSLLREVLAWGLYRDAGLPHCRARLAALHGEGSRFLGLYVELESLGKDFLRRNGLDADGGFWKCRSYFRDGPAVGFEEVAPASQSAWAELEELKAAINALEGPELVALLGRRLDVESLLDYQAVKCITSDEDSYLKNWLLHRSGGKGDGKEGSVWRVLPWDLDLSFGQVDLHGDELHTRKHPLMGARDYPRENVRWNGIIEAAFGRRAADHFIPALYGRIWRLLEGRFHPDVLLPAIDRLDRNTIAAARADLALWPRWGAEPRDPEPHRRALRDYVVARREFLREFLRAENPTARSAEGGPFRTFKYVLAPRLRFTEIQVDAAGSGELEFLELVSLETAPVDVSGWNIPAVGFVFPAGSRLEPGATCLVARDPEALRRGHRGLAIPVFGPYPGRLENQGEMLRLRDGGRRLGRSYYPETIDAVKYGREAPLPAAGAGRSLELRDLSLEGNDPASWRVSEAAGGSPGVAPPGRVRGGSD
jgi:hypothetical protein